MMWFVKINLDQARLQGIQVATIDSQYHKFIVFNKSTDKLMAT